MPETIVKKGIKRAFSGEIRLIVDHGWGKSTKSDGRWAISGRDKLRKRTEEVPLFPLHPRNN